MATAASKRPPIGPRPLLGTIRSLVERLPRPTRAPRSTGRRRARRRRVLGWMAVAVAAVGVHRTVAEARTARDAWTGSVPVLVLERSLDEDAPITARDVRTRRLPRELLPDGHLSVLPDDSVTAAHLPDGTVLSDALVTPRRGSAAARALPTGAVAVAVSTGDLPRLAEPGDVVDVAAPTWDAPVATGATVIDVDGSAVTLAVDEADAPATAAASLAGPVALVVRG